MKHVLITGATHGIGRACAAAFAGASYAVTAVARTAADLADMATEWAARYPEQPLRPVVADLADTRQLNGVPSGPYAVVVLNAAAFAPGPLLDPDADHFARLLPLNLLANHRLGRRLIPPMQRAGGGHLVVIGSTGTDHLPEQLTAYVATKYALRGLFLGWERELAGTSVRCTLVAPGATLTRSWANETPPPDILAPETVAARVLEVVRRGTGGRVTVS